MPPFEDFSSEDLAEEIWAMTEREEPSMVKAFLAAMASLLGISAVYRLTQQIDDGEIIGMSEAVNDILTNVSVDEKAFSSAQQSVMQQAGQLTADAVSIGPAYDGVSPRAVAASGNITSYLVRHVSESVQERLRQIISDQVEGIVTRDEARRRIRQQVGLLPQHAVAVQNLEASLLSSGVSVTQAQAQAAAYANRLLRYRAEMISRTEVARAASVGQQEYWEQLADDNFLPPNTLRKWIVTPDERLCEICGPMEDLLIPLDGFWSLNNGDQVYYPTDSHPNCRCSMGLVFPDQFGKADPLGLQRWLAMRPTIVKHAEHDQKTHGKWATGNVVTPKPAKAGLIEVDGREEILIEGWSKDGLLISHRFDFSSRVPSWRLTYEKWLNYWDSSALRQASAAWMGIDAPKSHFDDDVLAGLSSEFDWQGADARQPAEGYLYDSLSMMSTIAAAKPTEQKLYRGLDRVVPTSAVFRLSEGDTFVMPLSAWAESRSTAENFMEPPGDLQNNNYNYDVMFVLRPGAKAKAGTVVFDRYGKREYISQGAFRVVNVSESDRGRGSGDVQRTYELEQVAVWSPSRDGWVDRDGDGWVGEGTDDERFVGKLDTDGMKVPEWVWEHFDSMQGQRTLKKHAQHDQQSHGNWAKGISSRLNKLVEGFRDSVKPCSTADGSLSQCIRVEFQFRQWLEANHPELGYKSYYVRGAKPEAIDEDRLDFLDFDYAMDPDRIRQGQNHNIPVVGFPKKGGGVEWVVVDWTYRQFKPDSEWPLIESVEEAIGRWNESEVFNAKPPSSLSKHANHNQKDHGKWARGRGTSSSAGADQFDPRPYIEFKSRGRTSARAGVFYLWSNHSEIRPILDEIAELEAGGEAKNTARGQAAAFIQAKLQENNPLPNEPAFYRGTRLDSIPKPGEKITMEVRSWGGSADDANRFTTFGGKTEGLPVMLEVQPEDRKQFMVMDTTRWQWDENKLAEVVGGGTFRVVGTRQFRSGETTIVEVVQEEGAVATPDIQKHAEHDQKSHGNWASPEAKRLAAQLREAQRKERSLDLLKEFDWKSKGMQEARLTYEWLRGEARRGRRRDPVFPSQPGVGTAVFTSRAGELPGKAIVRKDSGEIEVVDITISDPFILGRKPKLKRKQKAFILDTLNKISPEFRPTHVQVEAKGNIGGGWYFQDQDIWRQNEIAISLWSIPGILDNSEIFEVFKSDTELATATGKPLKDISRWRKYIQSLQVQPSEKTWGHLERAVIHEAGHAAETRMWGSIKNSEYKTSSWNESISKKWINETKDWFAEHFMKVGDPNTAWAGKYTNGPGDQHYYLAATNQLGDTALGDKLRLKYNYEEYSQSDRRADAELFAEWFRFGVQGLPFPNGHILDRFFNGVIDGDGDGFIFDGTDQERRA